MFGKHFSSMYTGSMVGSGACVFAVWGYAIAHAIDSRVELNPKLLACVIGEPEEAIREAITKLEQPDAESRSKVNDGKRLIREGQFQYYIPTWSKYAAIRNEMERREYNRQKKREEREKKRSLTVNDKFDSQQMSAMSANIDVDVDIDRNTDASASLSGKPDGQKKKVTTAEEFEKLPGLAEFWKLLPRKARERSSKPRCLALWKKQKLEERAAQIIAGLKLWRASEKWTKDDGQYIEGADVWLRNERWEIVPTPAKLDEDEPGTDPALVASWVADNIRERDERLAREATKG